MKHERKSRLCYERGFSLIEMTLAVIVIGIMAVISVPRIMKTDKRIVHTATRQIVADMRYARGLAVANSRRYRVRFNWDGVIYTSYDIFWVDYLSVEHIAKTMEITDEVSCTLPLGGGDDWEISFTRFGSAEVGGTLINGDIVLIGLEGYTQKIAVIGATGMVRNYIPIVAEE